MLAEAATVKLKHHGDRLAFWEGTRDEVLAEARSSGIEIVTSSAGTTYNSGFAPRLSINDSLQERIAEAVKKVREHTGHCEQYRGWVEMLTQNPEARFPLTIDDWVFFFGK